MKAAVLGGGGSTVLILLAVLPTVVPLLYKQSIFTQVVLRARSGHGGRITVTLKKNGYGSGVCEAHSGEYY